MLLILVLLGASAIRTRLFTIPLERDEGEYALIAQGLRQGIAPYRDVMTMKLPGTPALYALTFLVLGETKEAIHEALCLASAATTIGLYLTARQLVHPLSALAAAAMFSVSSISSVFLGFTGNAEAFSLVFVIWGLWCLFLSNQRSGLWSLVGAGFCFALAVFCKQQCFLFGVAAGGSVLLQQQRAWRERLRRLVVLAVGPGFLGLGFAMWLQAQGVWSDFTTWVLVYPRAYLSQVDLTSIPSQFWNSAARIAVVEAPLLLLCVLGYFGRLGPTVSAQHRRQLSLFGLAAVMAVSVGFHFREHYFLLGLPFAALGAALWGQERIDRHQPRWAATMLALCITWPIATDFGTYWASSPAEISAAVYGVNPFLESEPAARIVAEATAAVDRVLLLGSEPQILFAAKRRPAVPYVYLYPLTEVHPLAEEFQYDFIQRVVANPPKLAIVVESPPSWGLREQSSTLILAWLQTDFRTLYEPFGDLPINRGGITLGRLVFYQRRESP